MSEKEILPESENPRREFMQKSLLGASALPDSVWQHLSRKVDNPQKSLEPEVINEVDILVVGSGSAGTTAAIQAGRAGAKTLLMERNSQLGGTTTTGGVAYPGLFDAWGKQVISGIGWELVKESVELDGGKFPDFSKVPRAHHHNQIHINQFLYSILAEEKCQEAGVEIAYYEFPTALTQTENGWQVDCMGFGTKRRVFVNRLLTVPVVPRWLAYLDLNAFVGGEATRLVPPSLRLDPPTTLHQANSTVFMYTVPTLQFSNCHPGQPNWKKNDSIQS